MTETIPPRLRAFRDGYRWDEVEHRPYKEDGSAPFRAISRQILFDEAPLSCELRYFEMDAGGYSTLERHEHMHGVMILRGHGTCLLGTEVRKVAPFDLVTIPPWTWHQFRATTEAPMGFLCMVNRERDRPSLPTEADLAGLRAHPAVAAFLDGK
ncbi:1-methylthio-D-xylulose 5-phosphate methylsulfurylase [Rhodovastum atsumiense]|uniref:Cupin domain-containing protein n=1 Tax=Rhodovastum atsumiense TaxID=504468 RepID=A0A5M6IV06_9PROT|nr:cupin domain-containing protein [Rhodovastum atsumiense]KAA5611245.1 cupin domain-containing protein [Rhodovastum atsumiense]CAH2603981.1 1-methylthio-D-xylulose 5-phosphate methylsulfurylase [Rhodovastum atsumiense]